MSFRIGHISPLHLTFEVINSLMQKGILSFEEGREIINKSLPPDMPEKERKELLDSLIIEREEKEEAEKKKVVKKGKS